MAASALNASLPSLVTDDRDPRREGDICFFPQREKIQKDYVLLWKRDTE